MRMWMVDPAKMCRQHLLGEHVELHMFVGTFRKGVRVEGYLSDNLLEPESIQSRHDELANEMERRGFNHKSPLTFDPWDYLGQSLSPSQIGTKIDRQAASKELFQRCPTCRERILLLES